MLGYDYVEDYLGNVTVIRDRDDTTVTLNGYSANGFLENMEELGEREESENVEIWDFWYEAYCSLYDDEMTVKSPTPPYQITRRA